MVAASIMIEVWIKWKAAMLLKTASDEHRTLDTKQSLFDNESTANISKFQNFVMSCDVMNKCNVQLKLRLDY